MSLVSAVLILSGLISAAGLVIILIRKSHGRSAALTRPLLAGVLCMNGIGVVLTVASRLSENAASSSAGILPAATLPMAMDTAVFGLKFGWLYAFLTFLRRFALPLGERRFRRLLAAVFLPFAVILAFGWLEFLLSSNREIFDKLQFVSDYFVFVAMIGTGLYLRSRTMVLVSREATKAMAVLAIFSVSLFLLLGLWWIIGGSVGQAAPALAAAFNPLVFLLFNGGLAFWALRFSSVLSGPEIERFVPSRIPESLSSRFRISRRECEIIELVGRGLSNQDIAQSLFISPYTVKKHLNNIFVKTGVVSRVQLAALFHFESGSKGETS